MTGSTSSLASLDAPAREALEERIGSVCVVYRDQPLPEGCDPAVGTLGVETDSAGAVRLLIGRGVRYAGDRSDVRDWLTSGGRDFADLTVALRWLDEVTGPPGERQHRLGTEALTDLTAVTSEAARPVVRAEDLASRMSADVVGQRAAIDEIARAAARHTAKVAPRRPLTMFLGGPTGVGKTLASTILAEALADLTDNGWEFHRLDMAEYSEAHKVALLHGAPPGYVGYGDGRSLASILRHGGPKVILFDEIDKAHPAVFRALLGLMDAGRLDSNGGTRAATAVRSILIFTSNTAADELVNTSRTKPGTDTRAEAMTALGRAGIAPELLGRLAHVSVFAPLSDTDRAQVAVISIQRVAHTYGVEVTWIDPTVVSRLLHSTSRSSLGVRALEHEVERQLGDAFATHHSGTPVSISATDEGVTLLGAERSAR